jgi:hypothetical protein
MVQRRFIGILFLALALFAQASVGPAASIDHRATETLCAIADSAASADAAAPAGDAAKTSHAHHCVLCGALAFHVAASILIAHRVEFLPRPIPPQPRSVVAASPINANAPPHAPPAFS